MTDHALEWLYANKETVLAASSWEDFIGKTGHMGGFYRKHAYLPAYFETIRAHPDTYHYRALSLPRARKASDLFEAAYLCPHVVLGAGQGSKTIAPEGTYYVGGIGSKFGPARTMGGRRSYRIASDGSKIRQHMGAVVWHVTQGKPSAALAALGEFASYGAVDREDGILIIGSYVGGIGSEWIALLDKGETMESLFDSETRAKLAADRQAEAEAFGEES